MDRGPARSSPEVVASMARGIAPARKAARPITEYACWRKAPAPRRSARPSASSAAARATLGIAREQPDQGGLDIQSQALPLVTLERFEGRLDLPRGLLQLALDQQGPENGQLDRVPPLGVLVPPEHLAGQLHRFGEAARPQKSLHQLCRDRVPV